MLDRSQYQMIILKSVSIVESLWTHRTDTREREKRTDVLLNTNDILINKNF